MAVHRPDVCGWHDDRVPDRGPHPRLRYTFILTYTGCLLYRRYIPIETIMRIVREGVKLHVYP